MSITYSTAASRAESARMREQSGRPLELMALVAVATVLLVGLALLYQARRLGWADAREGLADGRVLNLNAAPAVDSLLPLLSDVGANETERRFIADRIYRYLHQDTGARAAGSLEGVGGLGRIRVSVAEVIGQRRLENLRARAGSLSTAAGSKGGGEGTIALLSAEEVATIRSRAVVREPRTFTGLLCAAAALLLSGFFVAHLFLRLRGSRTDQLLLPSVALLCSIGFLSMVSLRDPLRDAPLFFRFAEGVAAGALLLALCARLDVQRLPLRKLTWVPLGGAMLLSALLIVFGSGPGGSDARVNLLGIQPVEAIRLLVVLFLAGYFANRWEFLRSLREPATPSFRAAAWFDLPRFDYVVPVVAGMALVLIFFFLQRDLGPALVLACAFLTLYGVARARVPMVFVGLTLLAGGFWIGYMLGIPATVVQRVGMWREPWENGLRGGDQVAHALWAIASGGFAGTGLGLGEPGQIPAGHTDLVLAATGEQIGFVGLLAVFALYGLIAYRSAGIVRRARGDYSFFLSLGVVVTLALQFLLIAGGQFGLLPLTGVVTPFLSYGRSSMLANFASIGILMAIGERLNPRARNREFDEPLKWVSLVFTVMAIAVLGRVGYAQVLQPDATAGAPVLAMQADGMQRYQYNPRLIEAARAIPRGAILDRNGLPMALTDRSILDARRADLGLLGLEPDSACRADGDRCYPFGGRTFHLLGDARTRVNYAATNTSFQERDSDRTLRGYDDYAHVVTVTDRNNGRVQVVRRNYRDLLPLWRYRHRPGHPAVREIMERPRDVRMTIDARLQLRVAGLLEERIRRSGSSRGAAVVMTDSGELLAAVSYPWPDLDALAQGRPAGEGQVAGDEALLDRARYGVYPPGSSFKMVTAAAALRADPRFATQTFMCERLPDGRVGQRIPGWTRPVRDDRADKVPHGILSLSRALVVSCNAYFAQLGQRIGPAALLETARLFEIPLAQPESAENLRDTLPFAAYGQGQVLATPFKMARVAATMAAGGMMPYGRWVIGKEGGRSEPPRAVLPASHAQMIAASMRSAVTEGTARVLRSVTPSIAGKTGTAEVRDQASHSWFAGFAPYDAPPGRRIAFAVIVENGGYGANTAAPIAGAIVEAARDLDIIR
ncbi:MAG: FtsW/RodA/SpoVE family cell cycle protein [Vicinamibacterales bacterium]